MFYRDLNVGGLPADGTSFRSHSAVVCTIPKGARDTTAPAGSACRDPGLLTSSASAYYLHPLGIEWPPRWRMPFYVLATPPVVSRPEDAARGQRVGTRQQH